MWSTKYAFILLPFMALSSFAQGFNRFNITPPFLNTTSIATPCAQNGTVTFKQLLWNVTATSTGTYYNLTVIPRVLHYPNNKTVTNYITITPTTKHPSPTMKILFGGSECVYPTECIEEPASSLPCYSTVSTPSEAPISATTLVPNVWTEPTQVSFISADNTTAKPVDPQPAATQPAADDPPSDAQPQPNSPAPRPGGSFPLPAPDDPLAPPASDATLLPQPQPSLAPQTSLLDPNDGSPRPTPSNPLILSVLDSSLTAPVPSAAAPGLTDSAPAPAITPFISLLLPSTTLLLQPGQATAINNVPVSFAAGSSALIIGTQTIPISLGTAASTLALSGIDLASGSGVTIVAGPSTTTGDSKKNSPSGAVRVLLPSTTLLLEPGQATAIGNTPVSFVAGGSAIVVGTQTIPISAGTAATTFDLSGIELVSGSGVVTAGSGVTVVFVPPATMGSNGDTGNEDPSRTTSTQGSGTETGVQSRASGPVMFTGAAARKVFRRNEWVWGVFGVVFM